MAKKKKGGPTSAHPPARAGASASQQAPRAPGRGISAAPPGARLVAEAAGLPGFWWRLHGIWEFVCRFLSRGVFWVVGDRKSAATHADGDGPSAATSHGDATRGATAASASDREVVASDAAPRRASAAAPKPAGPGLLGSSSPASRDKANAGSAASGSKIATSGSDKSTAFHSDVAEEAADSAQFLEAPHRITIKNSLMYTPLERQQPRPPPPPAPPLQVVDAIEVPREQEMLYREYCRLRTDCQGSSTLCHICVFYEKLTPNGIVANRRMIIHCSSEHNDSGIKCKDSKCQVRFKKSQPRDRSLHVHFCHKLPEGWWRHP